MSGRTVAIRYATALYQAAAEKKMTEVIVTDLTKLNEIMTAAPIREYCLKARANQVLEMLFINTAFIPYLSQTTGEMLKTAVRNGRLAALPYLFEALNIIINAESGIVEVMLESAGEIEKTVQKTIETKMAKRLGKKIKLNNIIVPKLLGGIRILWDNRLIDLSAIGRLKIMRTLLKAV
ncbi:MAG: ATP synthase F1 subunit delta [Candidatus Omnitrophica bacterium]|nr:ATP synthase F1 subunit delta [Candidatus Omnitrophota bacterium]